MDSYGRNHSVPDLHSPRSKVVFTAVCRAVYSVDSITAKDALKNSTRCAILLPRAGERFEHGSTT